MKITSQALIGTFLVMTVALFTGCGGSNRTANRDISDEQQEAEDAALAAEEAAEEAAEKAKQ